MAELLENESEFFFGLTLRGANCCKWWWPEQRGYDWHHLKITQALLGPEAQVGEINVVQVEGANTLDGRIAIPIATLTAGPNGASQLLLNLSFWSPPIRFRLLQGSGPVHIIGNQIVGGDW